MKKVVVQWLLVVTLWNVGGVCCIPSHRLKVEEGGGRGRVGEPQGDEMVFFEVSAPLDVPPQENPCSILILSHSFAYTYDLPPAMANYTPPAQCGTDWSQVILRWSGRCKGRQYDRIAAVWLSGVEILRTCTAEPTKQGIFWEVEKDITRFASLLREPQLVVLELANVVDSTYTGIFHINLTLDFYRRPFSSSPSGLGGGYVDGPPDVILGISLPSPLSGGYWFQLSNENETASKSLTIPQNTFRAVLEVCISFHGDDEFWYTNPPNEYIELNNLTGYPGNGPFREVQAFLDGRLVGSIWPFPVIYTGGINPMFWRPAAAIGSFNLPSYDIDITPFLGLLVDGKPHLFGLSVMNGIGEWPLDANLHLWLDRNSERTHGSLLAYHAPPLSLSSKSNFKGLDGYFHIRGKRHLTFVGFVESSIGVVITSSSSSMKFKNTQVYENGSNVQIVTQLTESSGEVVARTMSELIFSKRMRSSFPLSLYTIQEESGSLITQKCNLTHALNRDVHEITLGKKGSFHSLRNAQEAYGDIEANNYVITAYGGGLQQNYLSQDNNNGQGCYHRSLSTYNYSMIYDLIDTECIGISSDDGSSLVARAVLEVCISFHGDDEFWYTNPPNEYIELNNLTGYPGNGPFREVQAFLDGRLVGAIWPFPVIYTGGINPMFWRPAAAIGSFNLPSYDIDITPFLGLLVDGKSHLFGLKVRNGIGEWPLDANLHLWLDHGSKRTQGSLLAYHAPPLSLSSKSNFKGLDGHFHIRGKRHLNFVGFVESSTGIVITSSSSSMEFKNTQVYKNGSNVQIVTQLTESSGEVKARTMSEVIFSRRMWNSFPLSLYTIQEESGSLLTQECNLTHALNQDVHETSQGNKGSFYSLRNAQEAYGNIEAVDYVITANGGGSQQNYLSQDNNNGHGCYHRSISHYNYTMIYDFIDTKCIDIPLMPMALQGFESLVV